MIVQLIKKTQTALCKAC